MYQGIARGSLQDIWVTSDHARVGVDHYVDTQDGLLQVALHLYF